MIAVQYSKSKVIRKRNAIGGCKLKFIIIIIIMWVITFAPVSFHHSVFFHSQWRSERGYFATGREKPAFVQLLQVVFLAKVSCRLHHPMLAPALHSSPCGPDMDADVRFVNSHNSDQAGRCVRAHSSFYLLFQTSTSSLFLFMCAFEDH